MQSIQRWLEYERENLQAMRVNEGMDWKQRHGIIHTERHNLGLKGDTQDVRSGCNRKDVHVAVIHRSQ